MPRERCWNCDAELPEDASFCTTCGSVVAGPETPGRDAAQGAGTAEGAGAAQGQGPARYYASRYLSDGRVYVEQDGYWQSFAPDGAYRGGAGPIPPGLAVSLVEIYPEEGRRLVAARLRAPMGGPVGYPVASVRYAGFWLRVVARIVDTLAVGIPLLIARYLIFGLIIGSNGDAAYAAEQLFALAVWWLYSTLMESSSQQATLGKMAVGIVVTDLDGRRISWGRANARYWGQILSGLTFFVGYIMAGFTAKKQALHDIIAQTLVVRSPRRG
jgi:uncharacterized RDD family membrane protein YckC